MLPKAFNCEHRLWDEGQAAWLSVQRRALGEAGGPADPTAAVILHFVGRDKPWMRYERSPYTTADTAENLCKRLREASAETCARYLELQALWWRAFGEGRCLLVGNTAAGKRQGFVIDSFPTVLRMHRPTLPLADVGNVSRGMRCDDVERCLTQARAAGCAADDALLTLGGDRGLPEGVRTLLGDVYQPKLGVFGGPPLLRP